VTIRNSDSLQSDSGPSSTTHIWLYLTSVSSVKARLSCLFTRVEANLSDFISTCRGALHCSPGVVSMSLPSDGSTIVILLGFWRSWKDPILVLGAESIETSGVYVCALGRD